MNNPPIEIARVLDSLRQPSTIRRQAHKLLALAQKNQLTHFELHPERMQPTAEFVTQVILEQYPDLAVPYHSRWRHFEVGGVDRIRLMLNALKQLSPTTRGKMLYELVIISVLLDAGAGQAWSYTEGSTQNTYSRSEGLAIASLAMYQQGCFSNDPQRPLRVDAQRLIDITTQDLEAGFQVTKINPLAGAAGRVELLQRLGTTIRENPDYFGTAERLGDFYDYVCSLEENNTLSATRLFQAVLQAFKSIWPPRLVFHGVPLGDVWIHAALKNTALGSEYIPFHKLSQWLTYSLMEPLELAGMRVTELNELTGLPEYRNGGLLIDLSLLSLKNKADLLTPHDPSSELVVEWRALTVALLDELATTIRTNLQQDANTLPLAKILQGGTWEAGRRIAKQKRPLGTPPLQILSDGTVF